MAPPPLPRMGTGGFSNKGYIMSNEKWYEKVDWSLVTREHIDYTLNEASLSLETSLYSSEKLDKKCFFLMAIVMTYVLVLFPCILYSTNKEFIAPACIILLGFITVFGCLAWALKPQIYNDRGNSPSNTLYPATLNLDYVEFLKSELASYDVWINKNEESNARKGEFFNNALTLFVGSLASGWLCMVILKLSSLL